MTTYRYEGYRDDGTECSGKMEAQGPAQVAALLKKQGVFPIAVVVESTRTAGWKAFRNDAAFLPDLSRQLSILLSSGVPLLEALDTLFQEDAGPYRKILQDIRDRVAGGSGLSRALEAQGDLFPRFYVSMVQAGETSGALDRILVQLADFLENQRSLKQKIRSAMVYPVFMAFFSSLVVLFLFIFVIPKMVRLFRDTGGHLPWITQALIFLSAMVVDYWWLLILIILGFWAGIGYLKKARPKLWDRWLLSLPGGVLPPLYHARFARTMAFLLTGGVSLLKSLHLAAGSIGNRVLEDHVLAAEEKVGEGQSLHLSVPAFPVTMRQLIATGESTGRLPEVMERAAKAYEEAFVRKMERATALLEPLMILVMGAVVCFIVMAVLLPIFQLNQLIRA